MQRAEIEWGGVAARHALGRFPLNLVFVANASNCIRLHVVLGFPEGSSAAFSPHRNVITSSEHQVITSLHQVITSLHHFTTDEGRRPLILRFYNARRASPLEL